MEERARGGKPRLLSPASVTTLLGPKRLSQQTRPPRTYGAVTSELSPRRHSAVAAREPWDPAFRRHSKEMHAAGIPHRVLNAGSMQLKHSGNTPGPSGCVCEASRISTIS